MLSPCSGGSHALTWGRLQAFEVKIAREKHRQGCNCKKSGCVKKYCECFEVGAGACLWTRLQSHSLLSGTFCQLDMRSICLGCRRDSPVHAAYCFLLCVSDACATMSAFPSLTSHALGPPGAPADHR